MSSACSLGVMLRRDLAQKLLDGTQPVDRLNEFAGPGHLGCRKANAKSY